MACWQHNTRFHIRSRHDWTIAQQQRDRFHGYPRQSLIQNAAIPFSVSKDESPHCSLWLFSSVTHLPLVTADKLIGDITNTRHEVRRRLLAVFATRIDW